MEGKLYYTIGEIAEIMQTTTSQLRYWSGEFHLNVRKNRKGDRLFQKDDLEKLQLIQRMLKDEGYTIDGAKKKLKQGWKVDKAETVKNDFPVVQQVKDIERENVKSNQYDLIQRLKLIRDGLENLKVSVHVNFNS